VIQISSMQEINVVPVEIETVKRELKRISKGKS
jgi:hypothetical protein